MTHANENTDCLEYVVQGITTELRRARMKRDADDAMEALIRTSTVEICHSIENFRNKIVIEGMR